MKTSLNITILLTLALLFAVATMHAGEKIKLVILHTNDTHSQVEPTTHSSLPTSNMGGYARRMGIIQKIREQEENVLLLDAGDFYQGTPYFNFFNGRIEVDALNKMQYDAVTLGNHEFDNGIDTLTAVIKNAAFPIVVSNYDLTKTPLTNYVKPYHIVEKSGIRIGIFGLGIDPESLIIENNYHNMTYIDPIKTAQSISKHLKTTEKCDIVICLSHLGTNENSAVNDYHIAKNTKYIDVIIGGHSHQMINDTEVKNAKERNIIVAQSGRSGLYMGRIDLSIEKK